MQLFGNKLHLKSQETDWIEEAKGGDPRAQKHIYDQLSGKMYAVCLRYMGDREAARDILQDGFITLFGLPLKVRAMMDIEREKKEKSESK